MKNVKIHILLIPFIVSPLLSLPQMRSDLLRHNLKGKVHITLQSDYNPAGSSDKVKEKNLKRKEFCEYDEQGNLIRMSECNTKDLLTTNRTFISD